MSISKDILDDLCSRFIINIKKEDREDVVRLCFQIEQAYWFYLDFFCPESPNNPALSLLFKHIPSLNQYVNQVDEIIRDWKTYKSNIPVYGAILLDESLEKCLLVQGYSRSWSFPKGKVNYEEDPFKCAIREVEEETGFNMEPFADSAEFIERQLHNQNIRLYIVPKVPNDTKFEPQTRHEIRKIEWFRVSDLPVNKKFADTDIKRGMKPAYFFLVLAFIKPLKKWIGKFKSNQLKQKTKSKKNFVHLLNQRLPGLDIEPGKMYSHSHPSNQSNATTPVKPEKTRKGERRYSETALEDFSSYTGLSDNVTSVSEDQMIDDLKKLLSIKTTNKPAAIAELPKTASTVDNAVEDIAPKSLKTSIHPIEETLLKTPAVFENFKFDCQAITDQFYSACVTVNAKSP